MVRNARRLGAALYSSFKRSRIFSVLPRFSASFIERYPGPPIKVLWRSSSGRQWQTKAICTRRAIRAPGTTHACKRFLPEKVYLAVGSLLAQFSALEFVGDPSLKVTLMPRSELSCVVRTRSSWLRLHAPRVPLGKRQSRRSPSPR